MPRVEVASTDAIIRTVLLGTAVLEPADGTAIHGTGSPGQVLQGIAASETTSSVDC